jgi:hypothetical protein
MSKMETSLNEIKSKKEELLNNLIEEMDNMGHEKITIKPITPFHQNSDKVGGNIYMADMVIECNLCQSFIAYESEYVDFWTSYDDFGDYMCNEMIIKKALE